MRLSINSAGSFTVSAPKWYPAYLINKFLEDFFSPTERTVMAKRLAIAVLIAKGNDYRTIAQILKVTPITIFNYNQPRPD